MGGGDVGFTSGVEQMKAERGTREIASRTIINNGRVRKRESVKRGKNNRFSHPHWHWKESDIRVASSTRRPLRRVKTAGLSTRPAAWDRDRTIRLLFFRERSDGVNTRKQARPHLPREEGEVEEEQADRPSNEPLGTSCGRRNAS